MEQNPYGCCIELVEMWMGNSTKSDLYFGKLSTSLTTITVARLKHRGYMPMLDVYYELNPSLCEPPYARTARTVV